MDVDVLRTWHEQGKSEQLLASCANEQQPQPAACFFISAALIDLGREAEAKRRLETGVLSADDPLLKAEFLALLAFLKLRRGNFLGYLEGAQRAAQLAATPLTLYHLGLALPDPEASLETLYWALKLAEEQGDRHAATRNAFALGVPLLRLGRYREAWHWLRYGEMRCQHRGLRTALLYTRACVQIFLGETEGLEAELREALANVQPLHPWAQEPLSTALADLHQAEGRYQEALSIYRHWLAEAPRSYWPRLAHGAVRALAALEREDEARSIAQTALTVAQNSPLHQAAARLAMGLALWPERSAKDHLEAALDAFADGAVPLATEAAFHLAALHQLEDDPSEVHAVLPRLRNEAAALGSSGLKLLGGRALEVVQPLLDQASNKAFLLGTANVFKDGRRVTLRPRSLDILTLLLSHPHGLSAMRLSDEVYGKEADGALRVELHRLKKALGIAVETSPYRLVQGLESDYAEVEALMRAGHVEEAVRRYRGPLLPRSQAPGIVNLRTALETQVVEAALSGGDLDTIWRLVQVVTDDLRLWERLLELPKHDPRRYAVKARVAQLRREFA